MRRLSCGKDFLMFQEAFYKVEGTEAGKVLAEVNPHFSDISFDPGNTTLLAYDLPFYPQHRLMEITQASGTPRARRHFVHAPGRTTVLNWTSEPIYRLNREAPLVLTRETAPVYTRFFLGYVRGRNNRFRIAESVSDIPWREDPPVAVRKAVGRMIQPVQLISAGKSMPYDLFACMVHGASLYRATITLQTDGSVTFSDEECLVDDMPVRDEVLAL